MSAVKIGIIIGSTRPGRVGDQVANWVQERGAARTDATFEVVDLADFKLPHLDEALPAGYGQYANEHTKVWAAKVAEFDGFIFVTPEYNHSIPGGLKDAIDFVGAEWNNKSAGIVSYGAVGGARAAEHLRGILGEIQIADVRSHVALNLMTDFQEFTKFAPADFNLGVLDVQLDQVVAWAGALRTVREAAETEAQAA